MKLLIAFALVASASAQENVLYKDTVAGLFQPVHVLVPPDVAGRYARGFTDDDVASLLKNAEPRSYLEILGKRSSGVLVVEPALPTTVDFRIVAVKERPGAVAVYLFGGDGAYNFTLSRVVSSLGGAGSQAKAEEALNRLYGGNRDASLRYRKSHSANSMFYMNNDPSTGYMRSMIVIQPDAAFNALLDAGKLTYPDVDRLMRTNRTRAEVQEFSTARDVIVNAQPLGMSTTVSKFEWMLGLHRNGIFHYWIMGINPKHAEGCPLITAHVSSAADNDREALRHAAERMGIFHRVGGMFFTIETNRMPMTCVLDQVK